MSTVRRRTLLGAGLAAATVAGCSDASEATEGDFAIINVRIFDGDSFIDADSMLVKSGQISEIGTDLSIPNGVAEIDGSGKTLLPGFIDAHVHHPERFSRDTLRFGSTTICDLGSAGTRSLRRTLPIREDREQNERSDVFSAGIFITSPEGHGTQFGSLPTLEPDSDVPEFMAERMAEGPDFIKFMIESFHENTLTRDQAHEVVELAHEAGLLAVAHAQSWSDYAIAVEAGADIMAHAPGLAEAADASEAADAIDDDVIDMMVEQGTAVIATLAVFSSACGDTISRVADNPDIDPYLDAPQRIDVDEIAEATCNDDYFAANREGLRAVYDAGIPILAGTDYGNPGLVAGISLFHELELLHEVGLSIPEVLTTATAAVADAFGFDDRGRIAEGMWADLVLLEGDLTEQLPSPENIVDVWKNGIVVDRQP